MIIALHHGKSLVSRLIRWQTRSPYSHASLILPDGSVIESREPDTLWGIIVLLITGKGGGVRRVSLREAILPGEYADLFFAPPYLDEETEANMIAWLQSQIGKPYDLWMVLRFISRRQETRRTTGRWFCSELVAAAFRRAGITLLARTESWEVSPGLLARSPLILPHERVFRASTRLVRVPLP